MNDDYPNIRSYTQAHEPRKVTTPRHPEPVTLESCICGHCYHCPDGWHSGSELPCSCTADCALTDEGFEAEDWEGMSL